MDTVKNACGADIYYSAAVELMDDDIRDELAAAIAPYHRPGWANHGRGHRRGAACILRRFRDDLLTHMI